MDWRQERENRRRLHHSVKKRVHIEKLERLITCASIARADWKRNVEAEHVKNSRNT